MSKNSNESLVNQAEAQFAAGRFKQAGDLYKQLLKNAEQPEWRERLAECYRHRAKAMADKGMFKEAVVFWENYRRQAKQPQVGEDRYLLWLLAAGQKPQAVAELARFSAEQLDKQYPELAQWLGFFLVTGATELLAGIPETSALAVHWQWLSKALADADADVGEIESVIKKLPFRSPFRDFNLLLKAVLAEPETAMTTLAKIPETSPYRGLANALLLVVGQGSAMPRALMQLPEASRRIIANAKGLSKPQSDFLAKLYQQKAYLDSAKTQFNLVLNHRQLFGESAARAFCQGLLPQYPDGLNVFLKTFAIREPFERHRLQALLAERLDQPYAAQEHWLEICQLLQQQAVDDPGSTKRLAFILRYMGNHYEPEQAQDFYLQSLEYDPDDLETYEKILDYWAQEQNWKDHDAWLEQALRRFPKQVDLLARAIKSASRRKAFKKAAGYAQKLLAADPLSRLARKALFDSHLSHARRLLATKKYHLLEKELTAAGSLSVDKTFKPEIDLLRGFHQYLAVDKKQGLDAIVTALLTLNPDPVNAQFQAVIETDALDIPMAALTRALPDFKSHQLNETSLAHLIEAIKRYDQQLPNRRLLDKALDKIKAPLQRAMKVLPYREAVLLDWCDLMEDLERYDLLKLCARATVGVWDTPIWRYYRILASCQGEPHRCGFTAIFQLKTALEDALISNDHRAEFKIRQLLDRLAHYHQPSFSFFSPAPEPETLGDTELDPAIVKDLFGHLPPHDLTRLLAEYQHYAADLDSGELLVQAVADHAKPIAQSPRMLKVINNLDFILALVLLGLAKKLGIDAGLSIGQLADYFINLEN